MGQNWKKRSVRALTCIDPNTHVMMTILDEEELVASAVAYPGSTDEVQKVVIWANKYGIPIFPISMGRNCTLLFPDTFPSD